MIAIVLPLMYAGAAGHLQGTVAYEVAKAASGIGAFARAFP